MTRRIAAPFDRSLDMRRTLVLALIGLGLMGCPSSTSAQAFSGELECNIGAAAIGSFRSVDCRYSRMDQPTEFYTGYTGIVSTGFTQDATVPITFAVSSDHPRALAELQDDYDAALGGSAGSSIVVKQLVGNQSKVVLSQIAGYNSGLAIDLLNRLTGTNALHLIYAGVVGSSRRHALSQ